MAARALWIAALLVACAAEDSAGDADAMSGPATTDASSSGADGNSSPVTSSGDGVGTAPADASGSTSGAGPEVCVPGGGEPALAVGHGDASFESLDAHPAEIVYGVQGGIHIVIGLRTQFMDNSDDAVAVLRASVAGVEVGWSAPFADLVCTQDDGLEALGLLLIFDAMPDALHGQLALVEAELTDAAGNVVTAMGEVELIDPMQG